MDKKKETKNIAFKTFYKTMQCIYKYSRLYVFFVISTSLVLGFLPTVSLIVMQEILNRIQLEDIVLFGIVKLVCIYVLIEIAISLITSVKYYIDNRIVLNFNKQLNMQILDKAASLKLQEYEDSEIYNIIIRAQNQADTTIIDSFSTLMIVLQYIITCFSQLAILFTFNLSIVGIIIILPLVKYFFSVKFSKEQYLLVKNRTTDERKIWYISYLVTTGNAFKEIKLFNLKELFLKNYNKISQSIINNQIELNKKICIGQTVLDLLDQLVTGSVFAYIIYLGYRKIILIGDAISYSRCVFNIKSSLSNILNSIAILVKNAYFLNMLFEFLEKEEKEEEKIKIEVINDIELRNLSYKPANSTNYILKNINLKIEKNRTIVLVGLNGAGKTTLSKILMGFYDDYEGDIFINKINFKQIDNKSYLEKVSAVFQDFVKYEATLRENVAFGNLHYMQNAAEIYKMLDFVKFDKEIFTRNGLDMELGFWFDEGHQISTGEWQRLAIARAFIKKADVYILDEPNASLDVLTEAKIMEQYVEMCRGKIGIFVSHRVNSCYLNADEIIVLDKGEIIERGTHNQLVNKNGTYARLYEFKNYNS